MNTNPIDPATLDEMHDLRAKAHAWIDSLMVGGTSETAAVSAIQLALVERLLRAGGAGRTAAFLAGWQHMVAIDGGALAGEKPSGR